KDDPFSSLHRVLGFDLVYARYIQERLFYIDLSVPISDGIRINFCYSAALGSGSRWEPVSNIGIRARLFGFRSMFVLRVLDIPSISFSVSSGGRGERRPQGGPVRPRRRGALGRAPAGAATPAPPADGRPLGARPPARRRRRRRPPSGALGRA